MRLSDLSAALTGLTEANRPIRLRLSKGAGFENTCILLDKAKKFHNDIGTTYHEQSYAHFGADTKRVAWHRVVWAIDDRAAVTSADVLTLVADSKQGTLGLIDPAYRPPPGKSRSSFACTINPAADPGDQTVPMFSADHQLRSGKFKGIFRQAGYEHQSSYRDKAALDSTLYSLIQIAATMEWKK